MGDGKTVPIMFIFVVVPAMLPPDAFVECALRAISAVSEIMCPFI